MSSAISVLESPGACTFTLDTSPVTPHVEQPSLSVAGHSHSAAWYVGARVPSPSLANFTSELLLLLIEHLRSIDSESLRSLQRVCRRFYTLATPEIFRRVIINDALTQDGAEFQYPAAFRHMALYTRHVVVRSKLNPQGIQKILRTIHRLSTVHWHFEDNKLECDGVWLPSDLLYPSPKDLSDLRLSITNLPLHNFDTKAAASYTRAIPADLLVSLKLAYPTPPLTTRLGSLKDLLLRSSRLEVLYYQDRGQGTQFEFSQGERLPAVQQLTLKSYDWRHSAEDVRQHWDFSRLRSLELISMPTYNFFHAVRFRDLENLHTLYVEDWSAHLPDRKVEATQKLYVLIKHHIRRLESLEITCHIEKFHISAILKHSSSLKQLKFRDHAGFTEDSRQCPVLDIASLGRLADRLDHVRSLEIDFNCKMEDQEEFLRTICRFKKLDTLVLHSQTTLQNLEEVGAGTDPDSFAALNWFTVLVRCRSKTSPCRPWKKITLNMGGWRRVMVRRVGLRWRLLGQRGIHAERCFILEKGENQYDIREEVAFEAGGAAVAPAALPTPTMDGQWEA